MTQSTEDEAIIHWRVLWSSSWLFGWAVLFSFFVALLSLTLPFFMLLVYDRVLTARSQETLTALVVLALTLIVSLGFFDYARRRLLARFGARLQERLETQLIALPPRNATQSTKDALGLHELDQLRGFVHSGDLRNIIDVLWLPLFLCTVFFLNRSIGWLAIIGLLLLTLIQGLGWFLSSHRQREKERASADVKAANATLSRAGRWLAGQAFGPSAEASLISKRTAAREASLHAADRSNAFDVSLSMVRLAFSILVLSIGASLVLANALTVGGMIACLVLMNKVFFPYLAFLRALPKLRATKNDWSAIGARLAQRTTASTPHDIRAAKAPLLEWRNVAIGGDLDLDNVLEGVNLTVHPGEIIEVTGPSGAGKSLFCETMVWARRPARGLVLGHGYRFGSLRPEQISALVGYVPETPLFLKASVGENISSLDDVGHSDRTEKVSQIAGLHARVGYLPKAYETKIDEVGHPLSRGDRDRLSLARALYNDPKVVVIDNPSEILLTYFDSEGVEALTAFLAAGGALVLTARHPLPLALPARRFEISGNTLVPARNTNGANAGPAPKVRSVPRIVPEVGHQSGVQL